MGTLRFFEEVVSFKIRRTFGFADYRSFAGVFYRISLLVFVSGNITQGLKALASSKSSRA